MLIYLRVETTREHILSPPSWTTSQSTPRSLTRKPSVLWSPILRPKDEDEALRIASESPYGLESCVFTNNFYRMWKVAKDLEVGEVPISDVPTHGIGYFAFGGIKDSGMGGGRGLQHR